MSNARLLRFTALIALPFALTGCPRDKNAQDEFVAADAQIALEESGLDAQAQALSSDVVEISTNFTIGAGVESAMRNLAEFVKSQLPCASVSRAGTTVTVNYGVADAVCLYHGHVITGQSAVTISRNDVAEVVLEHEWNGLSNGVVQVDGTATVTYNLTVPSRHVVHEGTATRLSDGFAMEASGDRVQKPLAAGIAEGMEINGAREWISPRGSSSLDIEGVQVRWIDPVPQAGSYRLTTPKNRELTLGFARLDIDTITVTVASGSRRFKFNISRLGIVNQVE